MSGSPQHHRVEEARLIFVGRSQIWMVGAGETPLRAWAPEAASALPADVAVTVYLGSEDRVDGWLADRFAVDQRHFAGTDAAAPGSLECSGDCERIWLSPSPAPAREAGERCLACGSPLRSG